MARRKYETTQDDLIGNILDDRDLVADIIQRIKTTIEKEKDVSISLQNLGPILAKFIESLQRSNEQLMKAISTGRRRKEEPVDPEEEKEALYKALGS